MVLCCVCGFEMCCGVVDCVFVSVSVIVIIYLICRSGRPSLGRFVCMASVMVVHRPSSGAVLDISSLPSILHPLPTSILQLCFVGSPQPLPSQQPAYLLHQQPAHLFCQQPASSFAFPAPSILALPAASSLRTSSGQQLCVPSTQHPCFASSQQPSHF